MNLLWPDVAKALIGFFFGLLAFGIQRVFSRDRKTLIANISTFSLLSLPDTIRDQVSVLFRQKPVPNIFSHRITFLNSGNRVIENNDVSISIGQNAQILHAEPGNRFEQQSASEQLLKFKLRFLNPGDSTEIRVTTSGTASDEISVDGSGPGVKFIVGEKIIPVLDGNMTSEELRRQIQRVMFAKMKQQLPWFIVIYAVVLGVMFLVIEFFS